MSKGKAHPFRLCVPECRVECSANSNSGHITKVRFEVLFSQRLADFHTVLMLLLIARGAASGRATAESYSRFRAAGCCVALQRRRCDLEHALRSQPRRHRAGLHAHAAHAREDGLVGLLYFDLRPDTADTGTLLAARWLATSRDGLSWTDTVVWNPFDMASAPNARGLFLGDCMGLVSSGNRFLPLVVLSGTDLSNRNDAYLLPVTPGTTPAAVASTVAAPVQALSEAEFQARRNAITQRVMAQRLPDWGRRVRLQAPTSEAR